jgi:hypothetical protein
MGASNSTSTFVSAEGQVAGGEIFGVPEAGGGFKDTSTVSAGSTEMLGVMVYDPGPGFLSNVLIRVILPSTPADYGSLRSHE